VKAVAPDDVRHDHAGLQALGDKPGLVPTSVDGAQLR
jgi:hypothetical protein